MAIMPQFGSGPPNPNEHRPKHPILLALEKQQRPASWYGLPITVRAI
jgi:hypothetical protein